MIKKLFLTLCLLTNSAWANPVELVVPWAPGGTTDRVAQAIAVFAKPEFARQGITLNVVHRPGAGGLLGANAVASKTPGTLQILLAGNTMISTAIVNPGVATYDVTRDFVMLGYIGYTPMVMVVNSDSGIRSIADFRQACQQRKLNFGTAGNGSNTHISSALVNFYMACKATAVPYKGAAPAVTDLLGGHIDYLSDYEAGVLSHIQAGKLTAIVVLDRRRSRELPNTPTIVEAGYRDFNFYNWFALTANATATAEQLAQARRIFDYVLSLPALHEQLDQLGIRGRQSVPGDFLVTEQRNYMRILDNANIKP